ncbi:MAG: hypothetical protein HC849_25295 [Oscillatoriales cyanobacterium RU_3_3]|nr:hypothetical protein [Microcoleus sp. SM1_3_4]NJM62762.1 hypothetical protein [Oscillatoriales cyanobacterium RU_3_3]NJR25482.1 hypothetical protein [Richelia sp. CSU_2_1]
MLPTSFQPFGNSPYYLRITVDGSTPVEGRRKKAEERAKRAQRRGKRKGGKKEAVRGQKQYQ